MRVSHPRPGLAQLWRLGSRLRRSRGSGGIRGCAGATNAFHHTRSLSCMGVLDVVLVRGSGSSARLLSRGSSLCQSCLADETRRWRKGSAFLAGSPWPKVAILRQPRFICGLAAMIFASGRHRHRHMRPVEPRAPMCGNCAVSHLAGLVGH